MPIGKNLNLKRDQVIPEKKKENKTTSKLKEEDKKAQELPLEEITLSEENISEKNYGIIITPSKRKKVKKTNVELSGDLSINNIESIDKKVRPILNNYDKIDLYLKDVDKYDLSTIQLLHTYSTLHDTDDKVKLLKVIATLPNDLQKLTQISGFSDFINHYKG